MVIVFTKQRVKIAVSVLLGIGLIVISLIWNYRLSTIIDFISQGEDISADYVKVTIGIVLLMILTQTVKSLMAGYTCEKINHNIRMWYAGRYAKMNLRELEDISTGKEMSKLLNEVNEISVYISNNLLQRIDDFINFTFTFTWLLFINWKLALASNLPVLLIMVYISFSSKIISKMTAISQQEAERMNGLASSVSELFPVIKIYNAASMIYRNYETYTAGWEKAGVKEEKTKAGLMSLSAILSSVPLMLNLLVGGYMVIDGSLHIGTLYIFINLSGNVSGVMMNMPKHIAEFRRFTANLNRVTDGGQNGSFT